MQQVQCSSIHGLMTTYTSEYNPLDCQDTLGSTCSEHEEHFVVEEMEFNSSVCVETYLHNGNT